MKAKRTLAMLLCASIVLSTVSMAALGANEKPVVMPVSEATQTTPVTNSYGDSADSWAAPSIERWSASGVVKGDQNKNFNPTASLSRAELAQIFVNMLGLTVKAKNTFADLKGDEWYADAVLKCVAAGIMNGEGANINPERAISRQEAIVMFARAVGIAPASKPDLSKFSDAAGVATWAAGYLAPLTAMGILAGSGDGTVNATGYIDRASTVSLLDKAIATYVTAPGDYKAQDANRFVVVNAAAKDGAVVIEGTTAGVTVAAGTNKCKVVAKNLKTATVKVDGVAPVSVEGSSTVGEVVANATGAVSIASGVTVTTVTANAAAAIKNSGTIKALVANAPAAIDNKGSITKADIKADGVVLGGTRPKELTVAQGTKNPTNSTGQEVKLIGPSFTVFGNTKAFKGALFAEDKNGMITDFNKNRVLNFISVSLEKGDYNYKNVRIAVETAEANKNKIQVIVRDSTNTAYNILKSGWGPAEGFALKDKDIVVYLVGNEVGTYSATIKLVDVSNNNAVITSTSISIPVIDIEGKQAVIGTKTYAQMTDAGKAAVAGDTVEMVQSATLVNDVSVKQGVILNSLCGTTLTVPKGMTLTLKGSLTNEGTVENLGTIKLAGDIIDNGNIINVGTFNNRGTIDIAAVGYQNGDPCKNVFLNVEDFTSTGTITNRGYFDTAHTGNSTLSDTSTLTVQDDGIVEVYIRGTLNIDTGAKVIIGSKGTICVNEDGNLENKGQITIGKGGKLALGEKKPAMPVPTSPKDNSGDTTIAPVLLNAKTAKIINNGTIENYSFFENYGTLQNGDKLINPLFSIIQNEGDIQNHGTITNYGVIGNRGYSVSEETNEGFILNHGTVDNYSAIANAGTIINEESTAVADKEELTEGIIFNHKDGSLINAGDIYIGNGLVSGAISNGGNITNVVTGTIVNYDFIIPEAKDITNPNSELLYGTIVNEGDIVLAKNNVLAHDIKNKGVIVVSDAESLALAVKMGGTVRLDNNIVTTKTIVINNAVTLDGDNSCITGKIGGNATLLIGDGTKQLTDAVVIKDLIVSGPDSTTGWDKGEYAINAFWANNVTLDSVWMIHANAGMQVNSSSVTLKNDTCLETNKFGGIELTNGAGNHGPSALNIAKDAIITHMGNVGSTPAIWMDKDGVGTIIGGEALTKKIQADGKVYYYVAKTVKPVEFSMTDRNLRDTYEVNLGRTETDAQEYAWGVNFTCGGQEYQVITCHFKKGDSKPTTKTLQEMQTNLWRTEGEQFYAVAGAKVMLSVKGNTITWTFYPPDNMVGELKQLESFTISPSSGK